MNKRILKILFSNYYRDVENIFILIICYVRMLYLRDKIAANISDLARCPCPVNGLNWLLTRDRASSENFEKTTV